MFFNNIFAGTNVSLPQKYPGITFKLTEEKVPEIMNKCLLGDIDIFLTDGRIDGELFD